MLNLLFLGESGDTKLEDVKEEEEEDEDNQVDAHFPDTQIKVEHTEDNKWVINY